MGSGFFDTFAKVKARPAPAAPTDTPAASGAVTVSQLTASIESAIRQQVPSSNLVRGEMSNFNHHRGSGHLYFTLKDSGACIDCVMFKSDAQRLKFQPTDGLDVLARGRVSVYAQRGRYQLYVQHLWPVGQGALELAFQQLRARLSSEGLMDPSRKRALPAYPLRIALVTSRQTAALQDMLKVLRRFAWLKLMLLDVPVQGEGAGPRIADALDTLGRCHASVGGVDLVLLARGGGSLEDLWAFNDESLARAIARCPIPVVTGIGHEVDTSIADLVADYHAHTPTEAAQVATSGWRGVQEALLSSAVRLGRAGRAALGGATARLDAIQRHEFFRRPLDHIDRLRQSLDFRQESLRRAMAQRLGVGGSRLESLRERLDKHRPDRVLARWTDNLEQRGRRLSTAMARLLSRRRERLLRLATRLLEQHPRHRVRFTGLKLVDLDRRLRQAAHTHLLHRHQRLETLTKLLTALDPQQVLRRGYSITLVKKSGVVLRSAGQLKGGETLVTRLADGSVESVAETPGQERLF